MNAITTKHALDFMAMPWYNDLVPNNDGIMVFEVGTCHGQYLVSKEGLEIISITNDMPGNGHLEDVFEWFEFAAKQQGIDLYIRAFLNPQFKIHCIEKRGFRKFGTTDVMKKLKDLGKNKVKIL
jgi:N-acetylglutamate synthase-like GNAT family acetyltransferase